MPDPNPLAAFSSSLSALVASAAPSLLSVHSHRQLSSGFAWKTGLVVTADEALADEGDVTLTLPGGERAAARVVGRDSSTDVALLATDAALQPIAIDPLVLDPGALVLGIGARDGAAAAALGVVASAGPAWHSMRGGEIDARIELDLSLRRSSEGGLALDAEGRAFGMTVFGPRRRVLVIPAATIERVATKLESHGYIPRGYLGLGLQPISAAGHAGPAAMVTSVDAAGPGAAAGLHQGDVVVAWDGAPLSGVRALLRSLGSESIGREVTLGIRRAGEAHDVRLTIGERPAD